MLFLHKFFFSCSCPPVLCFCVDGGSGVHYDRNLVPQNGMELNNTQSKDKHNKERLFHFFLLTLQRAEIFYMYSYNLPLAHGMLVLLVYHSLRNSIIHETRFLFNLFKACLTIYCQSLFLRLFWFFLKLKHIQNN